MGMRNWPDLRGLTTETDFVVVSTKRSRSKRGNTRLVVWAPSGEVCDMMPWEFPIAETTQNAAILANGLRMVVGEKGDAPFTRGSACIQVVSNREGPMVYLYECHHGTLMPRYKWRLDYNRAYHNALRYLIERECASEELLADVDHRLFAKVEKRPLFEFWMHGQGGSIENPRLVMREKYLPMELTSDIANVKAVLDLPPEVLEHVGNRTMTVKVKVHKGYDDK